MTDQPPKSLLHSLAAGIFGPPQPEPGITMTPSLAQGLWSLAPPPPPVIQDRWFKDQTLHIDGYVFERCRFDNCKLVTVMATFTFRSCFIAPTTRVYYDGPALKAVKLLMHDLAIKQRIQPQSEEGGIFPTINPDGTFTLE